MDINWQKVCNLCSECEFIVKVEEFSDTEKIVKQILEIQSFPVNFKLKICEKCSSFLSDLQKFVSKCKQSLQMHERLLKEPKCSNRNKVKVRRKCGLTAEGNQDENEKNLDEAEDSHRTSNKDFQNEIKFSETKKPHKKRRDRDKSERKIKVDSIAEEPAIRKKEANDIFEYNCHLCSHKFDEMNPLIDHCKNYHYCLPEVNCVCGSILSTNTHLNVHRKKHLRANLKCKFCRATFISQQNYDVHLTKKHSESAVCEQCGASFIDKKLLKLHEKIHLPLEVKRIYCCDLCPKKFVAKFSLQMHMDSIHVKKFHFTCEFCARMFTSRANLKSHEITHSTVRNLECDICHMKFKSKNSLRAHKQRHSDRTFECKICHMKFRTSAVFSNHKSIHSNIRKHQCSNCPKNFNRKGALQIHLNVHTGEKPHACKFCSRCFANTANLRKHKLKDHPIELAEFEAKMKLNSEQIKN